MALFKVETAIDEATGRVSASLYYPAEAVEPVASTRPIYSTREEAEEDIIRIMQEALPAQPIRRA